MESIELTGSMQYCTILIMLRWPRGFHNWELAYLAIEGFGTWMFSSTLFVAVSVSVSKDKAASAITIYYLSQQLGIMVGTATTAAVTRSVFQGQLLKKLAMEPNVKEIVKNILQDNRFAFAHLSGKLQVAVANCYVQAFFATPMMCAISLALAFPALYYLPQRSLD
ncbi:hypothetical protein N7490_007827 [Penicillium lividum]|nr:hypothetical protein N7490_007827 [Penicillium lividum]